MTDVPVSDPRIKYKADGSLGLIFNGNRIDVIASSAGKISAAVKIDGKSPSKFPKLYYHTRPSLTPAANRPACNRIGNQAPLLEERWTARILKCDLKNDILLYEVSGSKTGPDGKGDHKKRFVSNSGRVVIEPHMWRVNWSLRYVKRSLPTNYQVTWQSKPLFVDIWEPPATMEPSKEDATVLAQGLTNGKHTLVLTPAVKGELPIKAFRIYRPPLKTQRSK